MSYQEQNDALVTSMLERTFFKAWQTRDPELLNFRGIEFILNYKCNLGCKYCYIHKFGEELYPSELYEDEYQILGNLEMVLDWFLANNYAPEIEFFSGEALVQDIGFKALSLILDKLGGKIETEIMIPTNYTFLLSDALTERVEALLSRGQEVGIPLFLSASFDGKHCEENRPFKYGSVDPRDDDYYDRCFAFAKKWKFGFHPMIYSEGIRNWEANFLWFQEMLRKHDIPWHNIYLLEIRNAEWSIQQTRDFTDFIQFLINWTYHNPCHGKASEYLRFLFEGRGFNILSNVLSTTGRGIGCSFQSQLYLRLGDLALVPCHRTSYEPFILGHLQVENDQIVGVKTRNPELAVFKHAFSARTFPYCEMCLIKPLCSFGCLGAQLETTGDLFTPIPTVCRLQHAKINSMIKVYKELGLLDFILNRINSEKAYAIRRLDELNE